MDSGEKDYFVGFGDVLRVCVGIVWEWGGSSWEAKVVERRGLRGELLMVSGKLGGGDEGEYGGCWSAEGLRMGGGRL